jgi:protein phosphatase
MPEEQEVTAPLDMETLQAGWAARSSARPRCFAALAFGAKTDLGRVRENNEDKFDYLEPDEPSVLATKGRVFAVADGMGGHSAGQIAAELALNVFIRSYYADASSNVEGALERAASEANSYVLDVANTIPGRRGMGATLTAMIVRDDDAFICQVGDSRCYLLRGGELRQLTEDHSWVAEQVRAGALTLEEAEASPFRNVITRSMGGAPDVDADVTAVRLEAGDRFLLCSDGLSGMVPEAEIAQILAAGSPSVAAWNLIERANAYGGKDNVSVFVLHVEEIRPWPDAGATEQRASEAVPAASNGSAPARTPEAPAGPEASDSAAADGADGGARPRRARRGLLGKLLGRE